MLVSAVIPAFNEEEHVGDVIKAIKDLPEIAEVIVVDDGSEDHTAEVAKNAGAKVIQLDENMGKGGAMLRGVKEAQQETVLFLDADLIGLTAQHIHDLITPIAEDKADMTVGIFDKGRISTDLAQFFSPYLSGQRVVSKQLILDMKVDPEDLRFGIEVAISVQAFEKLLRVENVVLSGMTHVMKEEKLGFSKGLMARLKMYKDIAAAGIKVVVSNKKDDEKYGEDK